MPIIDQTALELVIQDDHEMLADLASMFVDCLPDMKARLRMSVFDNDAIELRENAHQLKNRLGYFGALSLQQLACELEECGRDNQLEGITELLNNLFSGVESMLSELRHQTHLSLEVAED